MQGEAQGSRRESAAKRRLAEETRRDGPEDPCRGDIAFDTPKDACVRHVQSACEDAACEHPFPWSSAAEHAGHAPFTRPSRPAIFSPTDDVSFIIETIGVQGADTNGTAMRSSILPQRAIVRQPA